MAARYCVYVTVYIFTHISLCAVSETNAPALIMLQTAAQQQHARSGGGHGGLAGMDLTRPVVQEKLLARSGVFAIADSTCAAKNMPSITDWAQNDTIAEEIMNEWNAIMPKGLAQRDFGQDGSCLDKMPVPNDPSREERHVLTVVSDYVNEYPYLCPKAGKLAYKRFRVIEPFPFDVSQTPLNEREPAAPNRNYVTVWPLNDACTSTKKCPLVLYLHGRDEHAETANLDEAREMFRRVGQWGFLRYAERDEICAKELGSVMLFPQILVGESWVGNNQELMTHYVIPLLNDLKARYDSINFDWVSVVGYSEGALGALQASLWHPDIFSFALASAVALPSWENVTLPAKPSSLSTTARVYGKDWKLRAVVATFGHWDDIGTVADNMKRVSNLIEYFGADRMVDTHYRVYTDADHDHWENAFNQWPSMHNFLWSGNYNGHGLQDIERYQQRLLDNYEGNTRQSRS